MKRHDCSPVTHRTNGKMFSTRFKEYINFIKDTNNSSSKYAQNVWETNYTLGRIENTMDTIHITTKENSNATDKYYS